MYKVCSKCKTEKDRKEFNKSSSNKDGLNYYCKECARKDSSISHKKHREKNRIKNIEYWDKRKHRKWAIQTIRHHKKNYNVKISVDSLTEIAKKAKDCPLCGIKLLWGRKPKGKIV